MQTMEPPANQSPEGQAAHTSYGVIAEGDPDCEHVLYYHGRSTRNGVLYADFKCSKCGRIVSQRHGEAVTLEDLSLQPGTQELTSEDGNERMSDIRPGLVGEKSTIVGDASLATHLGSGGIGVYATPAMIALMESAAVAAIDPLLPEGQASVGIALDVRHLAATPPGQQVRARAEVTGVDGRKVAFKVQAWDEHELIGEGTHTRYVIDIARFLEGVGHKRDPGGTG